MHRRLRVAGVLAAAGVLALVFAALGTGGNAAKPSGSPIKVMTIAAVNTGVGTPYENIKEAGRIYSAWINDRGGINGHPIEYIFCDDKNDANQTAFCAREAVAKKVVAVVGTFTINGDRLVPILEKSKIAYFGPCCPFSATELHSPISFPTGSNIGLQDGTAVEAAKRCNSIGFVFVDIGPIRAFFEGMHRRALAAYGKKWKVEAIVPNGAADYSPQVAQVTNGTDCILMPIGETQIQSFMPAFKQSGSKAKLIGAQGNLDDKVCKHYEAQCEGAISVGEYPNQISPAWKTYRAALKQYNAKSGLDYNSLGALGTWAAFVNFAYVARNIKGPITNVSFLAQANRTTHIENGGITAPLDYTKPWNVKGFERVFTRSVTLDVYRNGRFVPLDNRYHDMTPAWYGKKVKD